MSLLLAVITVALSVCYYTLFQNQMLTQLSESYTDQLHLFSQQFDSIVSGAKTIAQLLYQNEDITGTLLSSVNEPRNNMQVKGKIDELYVKYDQAFQQARLSFEIVCFGENGFSYSTENLSDGEIDRLESFAWFTKQKSLGISDYTITNFWGSTAEESAGKPCFAIIRNLYNINGTYAGSIVVYVSEATLRAVYEEFSFSDNQFFLLNENSVVISSNNPEIIGTSLSYLPDYRFVRGRNSYSTYVNSDGMNCFSAKYRSPVTGWTIYQQIPLATMLAPLDQIIVRVVSVSIGGYLLILAVLIFTATCISRPLNAIVDGMRHSIHNHFAEIKVDTHLTEIDSIEKCYNHLCEQITKLLQDIRISERKANDANFNFLKAQINPHFLYNSLFSIKCTIAMGKGEKASEMLTLLITLLQNSVSSNKSENSLLDETIILSKYVKLQNFRYNDKVQLKIQLPEELMDISMPRFLIQPLVENVFLHAIPLTDVPVELLIRFKEVRNNLWIEVCDTGIGFSQEDLEQILQKTDVSASTHIGLQNIQERIQLLYGGSYGLSIADDSYFRTVVRLCIPKHVPRNIPDGKY